MLRFHVFDKLGTSQNVDVSLFLEACHLPKQDGAKRVPARRGPLCACVCAIL